jgi:hypothetical protein
MEALSTIHDVTGRSHVRVINPSIAKVQMKLWILVGCHVLPKSAEPILEAALIRASLADSMYAVAGAASAATRLAVSIANSNPEPV